MRFNITLIDPANYRFAHFLDDLVRLIQLGLEDLGHDCTIRKNKVERGRLNIVMGGHLLTSPEQVRLIAEQGPYIAFQGEILQENGINLANNGEYCEQIYYPFLRNAEYIWDGVPSNLPKLAEKGLKGHLLLGGYHPAMEQIRSRPNKDIDFFYFGSITPHRRELLDKLVARGHHVASAFDERANYRNDLISRATVQLSPGQGANMNQLPWTRLCFLLNNRCLIAAERCEDQAWLEQCFHSTTAQHWVELCEQLLYHPQRESIAQQNYDSFRQIPMARQVQKLLDESLSSQGSVPTPHIGMLAGQDLRAQTS